MRSFLPVKSGLEVRSGAGLPETPGRSRYVSNAMDGVTSVQVVRTGGQPAVGNYPPTYKVGGSIFKRMYQLLLLSETVRGYLKT